MPGYGVMCEGEGSGLLDWDWATSRLEASHDYWLASVRPNGRPHVMAVWGVYLGDRLWFSSSPQSRKVANIRTNPAVVVTTDNPFTPVIAEGDATEETDPTLVGAFALAMDAKYHTDYGLDFYAVNATVAVVPLRVFGIDGNDFTGSPTRWTFRHI